MAAIPKRSPRLNPRDSLTKITTGRKLRSKKIIADKSLQKIKVSANSNRLRSTSVNNNQTPIRSRLRPRRNNKNYCEDSRLSRRHLPSTQQDSIVILEKLNLVDSKKVPVYKAIKSEKSSEDNSDIYDFKFDLNDSREKVTKKKRKKKGNVKGKGKIVKKTARKRVVKIEIIDKEINKSLKHDTEFPATIIPIEPPSMSAVESTVAKSKGKDISEEIETPRICTDTDVPLIEESIDKDLENMEFTEIPIQKVQMNTDIPTVRELAMEDIAKEDEVPEADLSVRNKGDTILSYKTFAEQIKKQETRKPRIVSIENANNILVTKSSTPINQDQPFRPKNPFNNKTAIKQYASNCSLLTKSLSPIMKTASTFDFASPWRPSTLPLFSQAKHFIQSTPKVKPEMNKEDTRLNKENAEVINDENMNMDKENMEMNKENNYRTDKKRRRKILRGKRLIPREAARTSRDVQVTAASKAPLSAPSRVSLGQIKNLLQENPSKDINVDNKQTTKQAPVEVDESLVEQRSKNLTKEYLDFTDTFDIMSETERQQSNVEDDVQLFVDLEPSHFSKPPQHSYRRKRNVKFNFSENSEEEGEKENVKPQTKKRKLTKSEKEYEKRTNEWIQTINSTFQEIDEYDLIIE